MVCASHQTITVFIADASSPYVNVYAKDGRSWKSAINFVFPGDGRRVYLQGRTNPQEGGPKGVDVDRDLNVLVTTSAEQRLAFFDLPAMLNQPRIRWIGASDPGVAKGGSGKILKLSEKGGPEVAHPAFVRVK
jgi:hypothetical protein